MPTEPETQNCLNCYNASPHGAIYCSTCGEKLVSSSSKTTKVEPKKRSQISNSFDSEAKVQASSNLRGLSIAGGVTATVALVLGLVAYNASLMGSEAQIESNLSYEGYPQLREKFEAIPISDTDCESVSLLIDFEPFAVEAAEKLEIAKEAYLASTEFTAKDYLEENPWMRTARLPESEKPYGQFIRELSNPLLDKTILELDIDSQEEFNENSVDAWYNTYSNHVLKTCGLSEKFQEKKEIVTSFETAITSVINKAAREPWYPEGFQEVAGFAGFAFQTSDRACTFRGSCAVFYIVSKTDCSSNLYVQVNLLNGGVVVDWSNDTATVRAGQVALMETTFSYRGGGNLEFAKISCY